MAAEPAGRSTKGDVLYEQWRKRCADRGRVPDRCRLVMGDLSCPREILRGAKSQAGRKKARFFNKDYFDNTRPNLARLALLAAGTSRRVVETTIVSSLNWRVFWFQEIDGDAAEPPIVQLLGVVYKAGVVRVFYTCTAGREHVVKGGIREAGRSRRRRAAPSSGGFLTGGARRRGPWLHAAGGGSSGPRGRCP